jgi:hypothetical protein
MSAENRQLVINAIKDGVIKIGRIAALRDGDKFCAWGGVCEVYRQTTGVGSWRTPYAGKRFRNGEHEFRIHGRSYGFFPPFAVREWLDVPSEDQLIGCLDAFDPSEAVIKYLEAVN